MEDDLLILSFVTWNISIQDKEKIEGCSQRITPFLMRKFFTSFALSERSKHIPFTCLQQVGDTMPQSATELPVCRVMPACNAAVAGPDSVYDYTVQYVSLPHFETGFEDQYGGEIVYLKSKDNKIVCEFVLICYHMPSGEELESRRQRLSSFFKVVCEIANSQQKTVIVGGDFHISIDECEFEESLKSRIQVIKPRTQVNEKRLKDSIHDTFVIVYPAKGDFAHCTLEFHPANIGFIESTGAADEHFCPICYVDYDIKEIDSLIEEIKSENPDLQANLNRDSVMKCMGHDPVAMALIVEF